MLSERVKTILISDNGFNPNDYGNPVISIDRHKKCLIYCASPFVRLDRWVDYSIMRNCNGIIGAYRLPFTNEESPLWKFCKEYCIPFKNISLSEDVLNNYSYENDGCVYFRYNNGLLLVHIPENKRIVQNTSNEVIGLSANTVDLSNVDVLLINGKIYGEKRRNKYFRRLKECRDGKVEMQSKKSALAWSFSF